MHLERLMRENLQIFNLHYKMKTGKKFITKKMLLVNLETAKNQGMDNIIQIQLGKSKINNPNEILNAFNKHFITIAEKLTKN
jgi:hypothetical protein